MIIPLVVASVLLYSPAQGPRSIAYEARRVQGVWCHIVRVDLNADRVKVTAVVSRNLGELEPVESLIARARPTVAVSGTFHATYIRRPIGDIVIGGCPTHRGHFPSCLAIDWFNRARILTPKRGKRVDWGDYEFALGGLIRLMRNGKVAPEVGHNTAHVLKPSPRAAVGITPRNKLILVVTRQRVTLSDLGRVLKSLGASEAVCLDGGSSTTLFYRGALLARPSRPLTNLLVVYEDVRQYEAQKSALAPSRQKMARL